MKSEAIRRNSLKIVVIGLLFVSAGRFPSLLGSLYVNLSALILAEDVVSEPQSLPSVCFRIPTPQPARLAEIHRFAELALLRCRDHPQASWLEAGTALALGDYPKAATSFRRSPRLGRLNVLAHHDRLVALSRANAFAEALEAWRSKPGLPLYLPAARDAVSVACLSLGNEDALTAALDLRPDDLYLNYELWKRSVRLGDTAGADTYLRRLTRFSISSINPADPRLFKWFAPAVRALVEQGVWDRECMLRVAEFLVWHHSDSAEVRDLVQELVKRYPDDPQFRSVLTEVGIRRRSAEVRATVPDHSSSNLGGLRRSNPEGDFIRHGSFEQWTRGVPEGWCIADMATGGIWNRGLFFIGPDDINCSEGRRCLRIMGFWLEDKTEKEPGRYGVWYGTSKANGDGIVVPHAESVVIELWYRTAGLPDGGVGVWLTDEVSSASFPHELRLPATHGEWRHHRSVLRNPGISPLHLRPMIRLWHPGAMWADGIRVVTSTKTGQAEAPK